MRKKRKHLLRCPRIVRQSSFQTGLHPNAEAQTAAVLACTSEKISAAVPAFSQKPAMTGFRPHSRRLLWHDLVRTVPVERVNPYPAPLSAIRSGSGFRHGCAVFACLRESSRFYVLYYIRLREKVNVNPTCRARWHTFLRRAVRKTRKNAGLCALRLILRPAGIIIKSTVGASDKKLFSGGTL